MIDDTARQGPITPALRTSLGLFGGIAIAASSTAATTSIGIGIGVIAGVVGLHLPAVFLIAFLPVLGIAGAYAKLNRVEPNAGNGYVWVGSSVTPWLGFMVGWVNILATALFLAYTTAVTGSAMIQTAGEAGLRRVGNVELDAGSTAQTAALGLAMLAAVTIIAVIGVRVVARLQTALLIFEYLVLVGFCGYGIVAGSHPFSLSWFNPFEVPSASALAQGLMLCVFCYWGFETAFTLNEEVRNPRDAARAGITTLVMMLSLFLLGSVAFERVLSEDELAGHGAEALTFFGDRLAAMPLSILPAIALMFSAVASLQAGVIPTARSMFAMSRDRTLGARWSHVSARYGTPDAATLAVGLLSGAIVAAALVIPRLNDMVTATVSGIGIVVAFTYALIALAAAARFRGLLGAGPRQALQAVVIPAVSATALFALGCYLCWSFYTSTDHFEANADNGWFLLLIPTTLVITGVIAAAWAKWVRRSPYFATGHGTDADDIGLIRSAGHDRAEGSV